MTDSEATAAFYDRVASTYSEVVTGTEPEAPLDVGLLDHFVSLLPSTAAPVLDAGCGAGRMLTFLAQRGVDDLRGIDVSSQMVALARESHRSVPIAIGDIGDLPYAAESFRGVLCWYAIIHLRTPAVDEVVTELTRVMQSGGVALFGFQAGDGERVIERAYGHDATLKGVLHTTSSISDLLKNHGLDAIAVADRSPVGRERSGQGFVIARKP